MTVSGNLTVSSSSGATGNVVSPLASLPLPTAPPASAPTVQWEALVAWPT